MRMVYKCPHCGSTLSIEEYSKRIISGDPFAEFCMCEFLVPPNYLRILHRYRLVIDNETMEIKR